MFTKLSKIAVSVAAVATGLVATIGATQASSASAPLGHPRTAVHFNLAAGQTPENIALARHGNQYVTFAKARQVAEVTRGGAVRILATMPLPADGGVHTPALGFPLTVGITRDHDGTLYFLYATGTTDLTGVWRMHPGGRPERIAAMPANSLPNGLALDARTHTLYITDSEGAVWSVPATSVPATGGTATAWSTDPALAPAGFLGANGLKVHNGAIWATNLDKGTIARIPILPDGTAGPAQITATGLTGIDDFAFTGHGDQILAALDTVDQVALVQPDGTHTTVLTAADGLQGPTSIALRGDTAYIMSAAYLTGKDPNEITVHLND
ncbi:hypothetical protein ACFY6U_38250 [Streptomyces sp. NPDC013157]|uniref:hypothetical protein n=1 Tax=Streptomyces sp. NPDC013157 TaxID=3364861 RepID=UPI0036B454F1